MEGLLYYLIVEQVDVLCCSRQMSRLFARYVCQPSSTAFQIAARFSFARLILDEKLQRDEAERFHALMHLEEKSTSTIQTDARAKITNHEYRQLVARSTPCHAWRSSRLVRRTRMETGFTNQNARCSRRAPLSHACCSRDRDAPIRTRHRRRLRGTLWRIGSKMREHVWMSEERVMYRLSSWKPRAVNSFHPHVWHDLAPRHTLNNLSLSFNV